MVKEYTYLVSYLVQWRDGCVTNGDISVQIAADESMEDVEFYMTCHNTAKSFEEKTSRAQRSTIGNIVILNIINLTKLKPIMEV